MEVIRDEIRREGAIPFVRFMELALYHAEFGYYSRRADRGSRSGDFLTAPELHPLFGYALGRQLDEMWRLLDRPPVFTLRDYGAGSGALGVAVLEGLRRDGSELAEAMRYEPVETSSARVASIRERFETAGSEAQLGGTSAGLPFTGCAVANELIDALPVHRVVGGGEGGLREVFVTWRDDWFSDEPGEPSTDALVDYFKRAGVRLADGQLAEVNLRALESMARLGRDLERGFALIVDYGHAAEELYGPKRSKGTLLGYRAHKVDDDPYAAVGNQDLTTHVDFTAIEEAAREHGLEMLGRTTQAEFLTGLGLGELFVRHQREEATTVERYAEARASVLRLLDPRHLGGFKVLVLSRGLPAIPSLAGLSFRLPPR